MSIRTFAVVLAFSVALAGCQSGTDDAEDDADLITDSMPMPADSAAEAPPIYVEMPSQPDHNYDERRGSTYFYVAAISEEDEKRGRAVGSVSTIQYLGQNGEGQHILASLRPNGTINYRAKCANPCRIIDTDYGDPIAFSPNSIIGAAFGDAFRGKLRIADRSKDDADISPAAQKWTEPQEPVELISPSIDPPLPLNDEIGTSEEPNTESIEPQS